MSRYGPLLKSVEPHLQEDTKSSKSLKEGERVEIFYVNFLSLLAGVFYKNCAFAEYMLKLHSLRPSSINKPWRLCVYCDEVHPGNILNSSGRKAWCCYVSFLEFTTMLSKEDFWFTLSIIRTAQASKVSAGMSQIFRLLKEELFSSGTPQTGVLLSNDKGNMRLFFTLSMVLQDGAAHKAVWMRRQDVGSKPCMLCANIFHLKGGSDETEEKYCLSFASTASWSSQAMQTLLILGTEWLRDFMCFQA